jgi:hypothetical protein
MEKSHELTSTYIALLEQVDLSLNRFVVCYLVKTYAITIIFTNTWKITSHSRFTRLHKNEKSHRSLPMSKTSYKYLDFNSGTKRVRSSKSPKRAISSNNRLSNDKNIFEKPRNLQGNRNNYEATWSKFDETQKKYRFTERV